MGITQGVSLVLQFAVSVILARLLTPYQLGIYGIAAATAGFLGVIQAIGLQALIVREEVLTTELRSTAFTINALLSVLISAGIAGMSFFGASFLHDRGVGDVLLVMAINPLLGIASFLPSAILERHGQFKLLSLATTIGSLVGTCSVIVLAFRGFSYMSMPIGGTFGAAVGAVILNIIGRRHVSFQIGFIAWRRAATFGFQMLTISGVAALSQRISELMLGRLQGLSALAMYNRGNNLNSLLWTNIYFVISRVIFVDFAQLNREGVPLRERYLQMVDIMTAALWPAFAGVAIIGGPIIRYVYGVKWLPAAPALSALAVASMISIAITMIWEIFAATGNLGVQSRLEVFSAGFSAIVFVAGAVFFVTLAAVSRIVTSLFAFFLYRPYMDRMTGTTYKDLLPIYWRNGGLTLLTISPLGCFVGVRAEDVGLVQLIAAAALSTVFWIGGLAWLKHPLIGEARRIVARGADLGVSRLRRRNSGGAHN